MKTENKVLFVSFFFCVFIWLTDSMVDAYFFSEKTLLELALTDIPIHGLFVRLIIMVCFVVFALICSRLIVAQKKTEKHLASALFFQQQLIDSIPLPIFYKDEHYIYLGCNKSYEAFMGLDRQEIIGKSVYDLASAKLAEVYQERDAKLINHPGVQVYEFEVERQSDGENRQVIFHKAPFTNFDGKVAGLIGAIVDITERNRVEQEKETLIRQLQEALDKVKLLSGFLPICSSCKKIRDDRGYWKQIETYIHEHSEAEFSHGICPECLKKLYPDYARKVQNR